MSLLDRQQNILAVRPDWVVTLGWQEEMLIVPRLLREVGEEEGEGEMAFVFSVTSKHARKYLTC